jgi:hypothetical protein
MKQHKWHKEIKHLADGGEIEYRTKLGKGIWSDWSVWDEDYFPEFNNDIADEEYRIKPQPKEPQYLYVYLDDDYEFSPIPLTGEWEYIGKIKMETEDESN